MDGAVKSRHIRVRFLLFAVLIARMGWGQNPSAFDLLHEVERTYRDLNSFELQGTDSLRNWINGHEQAINHPVLIRFMKPALMRMDYQDDWGVRVTNDQYVWQYVRSMNRYNKEPRSTDFSVRHFQQESFQDWEQISDGAKAARLLGKDTVQVNGTKVECFVVEITYPPTKFFPSDDRKKTFWIGAKSYLVYRISSEGKVFVEGRAISPPPRFHSEFVVHSIQLNKPLARSIFDYVPPSDAINGISPAPRIEVGTSAADFTLPDLNGEPVSLSALRGKPVLLYFWATWCMPCRAEMPIISKVAQEFAPQGLVTLGVNDEPKDTVIRYVRQHNYSLRFIIDAEGHVIKSYNASELPAMILIDKAGKLAWSGGPAPEDVIRAALKGVGLD